MDIANETGVVILSGGNSARMNYPKAFLNLSNITLIEYLLKKYINTRLNKLVIVLNYKLFNDKFSEIINELKSKSVIVKNSNPENGRIYSLKLGLNELKYNKFCFIQNIDNPVVDEILLNKMMKNAKEDSYVAPLYKGKSGHPVLIGSNIINQIIKNTDLNLTLKDLLSPFKRIDVDSDGLNVLENINTQQDWANYIQKQKENAKHN